MNIAAFTSSTHSQTIAYCMIDNTHSYKTNWVSELMKNQADYTITNVYSKGYNLYQGISEDYVLNYVANLDYSHAVVFSTGTEFINGDDFFKQVELLINEEFIVAGHILDRGDAYYELHEQCYVVNLIKYKELKCPLIGKQLLGSKHDTVSPIRSVDNYHDEYTPIWISSGTDIAKYNHKCHGWNILQEALTNNLPVIIFDNTIRSSKKHYYPENQPEFNKHIQWAYNRQALCATTFIHTENTDWCSSPASLIQQVVTPASGTWWLNVIDENETQIDVIFYDYNINSLNYWKDNAPVRKNINYKFLHCDLLNDDVDFSKILDCKKPTLINLSNIFAYEGTTLLYNLEYRAHKENLLIRHLQEIIPDAYVNFSARASTGFKECPMYSKASNLSLTVLDTLNTPTWHINDWR